MNKDDTARLNRLLDLYRDAVKLAASVGGNEEWERVGAARFAILDFVATKGGEA